MKIMYKTLFTRLIKNIIEFLLYYKHLEGFLVLGDNEIFYAGMTFKFKDIPKIDNKIIIKEISKYFVVEKTNLPSNDQYDIYF